MGDDGRILSAIPEHTCEKGRHCDQCKREKARYNAERKAYYRSIVASSDDENLSETEKAFLARLAHARPNTYLWYGCRCGPCRRAVREYWRLSKSDYRSRNLIQ